jgi:hypothetical protein
MHFFTLLCPLSINVFSHVIFLILKNNALKPKKKKTKKHKKNYKLILKVNRTRKT